MVLGASKSKAISDMGKTADNEPLENRFQTKILVLSEKTKRLPSYLFCDRLNEGAKNRLKEKSCTILPRP